MSLASDVLGLDSTAKALVVGLIPVVDEAIHKATTEMIPALGVQLQAGIRQAVEGLNADSKEAIDALADRVDKLIPEAEAAGKRLIEYFMSQLFTELRKTLGGLGSK